MADREAAALLKKSCARATPIRQAGQRASGSGMEPRSVWAGRVISWPPLLIYLKRYGPNPTSNRDAYPDETCRILGVKRKNPICPKDHTRRRQHDFPALCVNTSFGQPFYFRGRDEVGFPAVHRPDNICFNFTTDCPSCPRQYFSGLPDGIGLCSPRGVHFCVLLRCLFGDCLKERVSRLNMYRDLHDSKPH